VYGGGHQPLVRRPQGRVSRQPGGREQLSVDVADAAPVQLMALDVQKGLLVGGDGGLW
jgi:hypothetical protein